MYLLELELTAVAGGNLAGSKTLKVAICHSDRACSPFLLALDRVVDVLQFSYVPFEITPPPLGKAFCKDIVGLSIRLPFGSHEAQQIAQAVGVGAQALASVASLGDDRRFV